jgi:hypothetical protein
MFRAFKRLDTVDKYLALGFIVILVIAKINGIDLGK